MKKPIVIAHRGGSGLAPENTLQAFGNGLGVGADGVELDLQLSDGGELIVFHDTLEPGEVRPQAPRLGRSLDLILERKPDALVVIDLKAAPWNPALRDQGRRLVDAAAVVLAAHPRPDRVILGSFDWDALEHAAVVLPQCPTAFHTMATRWLAGLSPRQTGICDTVELLAYLEGWRQDRWPGTEALSPLELIRGAGARIWSCLHRDLTADAVAKARALDLQVWTWTVNTAADLERVLALGVDAVTTDWPDRVITYLETGQWNA